MRSNPPDHGRYEHSDVHAKPIVIAAAVLAVSALLAAAVGYWLMRTVFAGGEQVAHVRAEDNMRWTTPVRVQASPPMDFLRYRDQQTAITMSYATISTEPEIFSIPVETALEVVAENGLPEFRTLVPEGTQALMEALPAAASDDTSGQTETPQAPQISQEP